MRVEITLKFFHDYDGNVKKLKDAQKFIEPWIKASYANNKVELADILDMPQWKTPCHTHDSCYYNICFWDKLDEIRENFEGLKLFDRYSAVKELIINNFIEEMHSMGLNIILLDPCLTMTELSYAKFILESDDYIDKDKLEENINKAALAARDAVRISNKKDYFKYYTSILYYEGGYYYDKDNQSPYLNVYIDDKKSKVEFINFGYAFFKVVCHSIKVDNTEVSTSKLVSASKSAKSESEDPKYILYEAINRGRISIDDKEELGIDHDDKTITNIWKSMLKRDEFSEKQLKYLELAKRSIR